MTKGAPTRRKYRRQARTPPNSPPKNTSPPVQTNWNQRQSSQAPYWITHHSFAPNTPPKNAQIPPSVVIGKGGEMYYTPDHYQTFVPLK